MAITRIKNNQITDLTITNAKIDNSTITGAKLAPNLTYGSDLSISGNLSVAGTTVTVDSTNTTIADPLITLSKNTTGTPSWDAGILIERGTQTNVAWIWDETNQQFAGVFTNDDGSTNGAIATTGYVNLQVASIAGNGSAFGNIAIGGNTISSTDLNGNIILDPNGTGLVKIDAIEVIGGTIDGTAIGVTTPDTGNFTSLTASGAVSGASLAITNGVTIGTSLDVTGLSTLADITSSGNISATGTLSISGATTLSSTLSAGATTVSSLSSSGNATIGGTLDVTGLATFTAGADMTGDTIVNVANPVNAQDAATKSYVDSAISGGFNVTDGTLTSTVPGGTTLAFAGTTNEVEIALNTTTNTLTFGLPNDVTIGNDLTVTGNTQTADITASGNAAITGTLSAGASTLSSVAVTGAATVGGTLGVTGNTTLTTVTTSGAATLASASVTGNASVGGTLTVTDDVDVGAGNFTVDAQTGNTTVAGTLGVTGNTSITGTLSSGAATVASLTSNGASSVNGTLAVSDDFAIATNKFTVDALTGNTAIAGTLDVTGNTNLSTVSTSGLATLDSAIVTNNASVGGNFTVTGSTTVGAFTAGASTLASANVTGAGSIGTTLSVGTDLTVGGNTSITGTLSSGALTASNITDSSLTAGRVVFAGTAGDLSDSSSLLFNSTTGELSVTGSLIVDDITVDGSTITSATGTGIAFSSATGVIDAGTSRISNVVDPVNAQDAATKAYVDGLSSSGFVLSDGTNTSTISGGDTMVVAGTANEVDVAVTAGGDTVTIGLPDDVTVGNNLTVANNLAVTGSATIGANITIAGNLTVQGSTTTIESVVSVVNDPIMQIGTGSTAPTTNDGKDRGIAFDWYDTAARQGFFGFDNSTGAFTYIPDATITAEVVSGTPGAAAFGSIQLSNIGDNQLVVGGANGALETDANLTWDGSTLGVTGDVTVSGTTTMGNVAVSGTSIITTTSNSDLNLTPNGTGAVVINNADINGGAIDNTPIGANVPSTGAFTTLDASGNATVGGTVDVTGATTLSSTLAVSGATTLSDTLDVTGNTTINSNFRMNGGIGETFVIASGAPGDLGASDVFTVNSANGNTTITGTLSSGDATVASLSSTGNATVGGTLGVTGATTLSSTLDVAGNFAIATNKFTVDSVTGDTVIAGTASITGNTTITGTLSSGAATVASLSSTGNATVGGTLGVTGLATFTAGADMTGDNIVNVADPVNAQDAATKAYVDSVAAGGWTVTDGTNSSIISGGDTLTVSGTANEIEVAVSAGLDTLTIGLPDDVTIAGVATIGGNATVAGTLGVTGATTLSSTLTAGASTLASATITGAATVGTTLGVTGNTTIGGTLGVTGAATFSDTADVAGNFSVATNKFTVNATTGDAVVAGTLTAGASTLASATITGAATVGTTLGVTGNTTIGGTLDAGASTLASLAVTNNATVGGTLGVTGNTTVGGTLDSAGNFSVATNKFTVDALSGDTAVAGDLSVAGNTSVTGTLTAAGVTDSTLTATGVVFAGTGGALTTDTTFVYDDVQNRLTLNGTLAVDAVRITGNDITVATGAELTINEAGADVNVRMEGLNDANVFVLDAGQDNIGIGTATPNAEAKLHINATNSMIVPVGTTAERPATPVAGMYRFNSTLGTQEIYDGTQWISGVQFTVVADDQFNGDDTTTQFTLSQNATSSSAIVSINGVVQIPGSAYGISGNVLTFTTAPATGDVIDVRMLTTTSSVQTITGVGGTVDVDANGDGIEVTGALISKNAATTTSTTGTVIDSFDATKYRSAKYVVQATSGTDYEVSEILVLHDGTNAYVTQYGVLETNASLGSISVAISGGNVEVTYTAVTAGTDVKVAMPTYLEV